MKRLFKLNTLYLIRNDYFWLGMGGIAIVLLCMCITSMDEGISKVGLFNIIVLITSFVQFVHINNMIRSGLREKSLIQLGGKKVKTSEFIFLTVVVTFLVFVLLGGIALLWGLSGLNGMDLVYILLSIIYVSVNCYATTDVFKLYGIGNILCAFILMNLSALAFGGGPKMLNYIFPIRWWILSGNDREPGGCIKLLIYDIVMLFVSYPIGLKRLKRLYK